MTRLHLESITDQVRDLIVQDIEDGKFAPGERIYEDKLAKELGISKTPLRLAIHQLREAGILRVEPRQGIYVAQPTMQEVMELAEAREVLEGLAARRAAAGTNPELVQELKDCFAGFDEDGLDDKRTAYAAADHKFHQLLARASGSSELIQMLNIINLRLHMNQMRTTVMHQHNLVPTHRGHMSIIDAIEAGDGERAEASTRAHVRGVPWQAAFGDKAPDEVGLAEEPH